VGDRIKDHTIFTLENPFRIVVDIRQEMLPKKEEAGRSASDGRAMRTLGTPLTDELKIASKFGPAPRPSQEVKPTEKAVVQKKTSVTPLDSGDAVASSARKKAQSESVASSQDAAIKGPNPPTGGRKSEEVAVSTVPLPKSDGTRSLIRMLGLKIGRIVIDPGHGGHDTGTIGPSGVMEKDLVLDVALRLKDLIEERLGGEVVLTRTDDTFIPLERRTEIANENQADLFVSIHANSSRDRAVRGIETFYLDFTSSPDNEEIASRENATSEKTIFELQDLVRKIALKEKIDESREFALVVQKSILKQVQKTAPRSGNRGVKQAPFIVLIGAHMPSILAELSFLSNPADEKLLRTSSYRQKIAQALCHGIEDYTRNLGGIKTARKLP
jgi:N-acetylmuramoyl-L-alanine amidase